ncbi:hypothetical protein PUN28_011452 [Cardiocondyla obscurior]|uniref:Uncharacterized protein n=1 Tax=Cardiocondyla obscurior TaxID=286306 RepID=A0AAW2FE57_9HYME
MNKMNSVLMTEVRREPRAGAHPGAPPGHPEPPLPSLFFSRAPFNSYFLSLLLLNRLPFHSPRPSVRCRYLRIMLQANQCPG